MPTTKSSTNLLTVTLPAEWHTAIKELKAFDLSPYCELTRINKPAGVLAIYPPYLLGVLVSELRHPPPQGGWPASLSLHIWVLVSAFLLRSAGCVWNDVIDRKVDRLVARSKSRPIARGAISPQAGTLTFVLLTLVWLATVGKINPRAIPFAVSNVPSVMIYPYAKRFTDFPQAFLGLTLSWGVVSGYVMGGTESLWSEGHELHVALFAIAAAWVVFTMFYDTIYAYQDVECDHDAGVRSTAVVFGTKGKFILTLLSLLQAALMAIAGVELETCGLFFAGCVLTSMYELYVVWKVDLSEPKSCAGWFKKSLLAVSGLMALSIVVTRLA